MPDPVFPIEGLTCAVAYQNAGDLASALQLRPNMPGTLSNLGSALLALGQMEEALGLFHQALATGATGGPVLVNIARAEQVLGRDAAAPWQAACDADTNAAEQRWQRTNAILPYIPETVAQVEAPCPAYAAGLNEIEAWYDEDKVGRPDRLWLAMPFFLAYQPPDNRALLERFGTLRCKVRTQSQPASRPRHARTVPLKFAVISPDL